MKYTVVGALALSLAVGFTGCGSSGGGSSEGDETSSVSSTAQSSVSSVAQSSSSAGVSSVGASSSVSGGGSVPYTCTDSFSYGSYVYSIQSGTQGDITYDCQVMSSDYGYHLSVDVMTVTAVSKVQTMSGTIDGKTGNSTIAYDYVNGTIHYSGSYEGYGSFNCTETYQTSLPATFYSTDPYSLEELLDYWGDYEDDNFISTTCPQDFYDEGDGSTATTAHLNYITEITVTDDQGGQHKISKNEQMDIN